MTELNLSNTQNGTGYLVRLEYLTAGGWSVGHAGIRLLHPQRYVDGLAEKNKFGRCIELDDRLQATGQVWEPPSLPDPKDLVPSDTKVPQLKRPSPLCPECGEDHTTPWECLL